MVYWLTGQPGGGKTELGKLLVGDFVNAPFLVDGDMLRQLTENTDYSEVGRRLNVSRAQSIALDCRNMKYDSVVSLVSPYRNQREEFKQLYDVTEIYVHTTEDRGKNQFHVPNYEPPIENFIDIDTTGLTIEESYKELIEKINGFSK